MCVIFKLDTFRRSRTPRRLRSRPPAALTSAAPVSAHGRRRVEAQPRPRPRRPARRRRRRRCASSSSYLPASLDDGSTAADRPAAAHSPDRGRRVFRFPRLDRLVTWFACVFPGGNRRPRPCQLGSRCPSRNMEKMARPLPVNPTFLPPTHGVLKSLLENPLKLPFHHEEGRLLHLTRRLSGLLRHPRVGHDDSPCLRRVNLCPILRS